MGWARYWAIFSKSHLVTLIAKDFSESGFLFCPVLGKKVCLSKAWSLIRNKNNCSLWYDNYHVTVKSDAIACARICRPSRLTGWWTRKKNIREKWRAMGEERHKGLLMTPPPKKKNRDRGKLNCNVIVSTFSVFTKRPHFGFEVCNA
jgi:hypothetical protein